MPSNQPPSAPSPRSRPSPALILFLVFPLLGLIAAAIVLVTSSGAARTAASPTPEPVTLPPPKAVADSPMIDFTLTSLDGKPSA